MHPSKALQTIRFLLDGRKHSSYYRFMKLSVSVPDELWEQACRRVDYDSPSAVVQAALSRFVGDTGGNVDYAVRPDSAGELARALSAARAHIINDARELYQRGYRDGVKLAAELSFGQLAYIVRVGAKKAAQSQARLKIEIETGLAYVPEGSQPLIEPRVLIDYLGSYADYTGGEFHTPAPPTIEGLDRALADVWESVHDVDRDAGTPLIEQGR